MGGDGGTIPGRKDLVKEKKKRKKAINVSFGRSRLSRWTHCTLSNDHLSQPIVMDYLGNLFNKQSLLLQWYHKTLPKQLSHIKKYKRDTIALNICVRKDIDKVNVDDQDTGGFFQCPITNLVGNGKYPFICLTKCGCVMSKKALCEIPSKHCLVCGMEMEDIRENPLARIPINASQETQDELRELWIRHIKSKKKDRKKRSNNHAKTHKDMTCDEKKEDDTTGGKEGSEEKTDNDSNNNNKRKKMSKKRREELKRQIEEELKKQEALVKKEFSVLGKRSLPEDIDRSVENQKKKSKVFDSLFKMKEREYNFTGGGKQL